MMKKENRPGITSIIWQAGTERFTNLGMGSGQNAGHQGAPSLKTLYPSFGFPIILSRSS